MAIDFPASPNINDTHTDVGKTWRYDGYSWNLEVNSSSYTLPIATASALGGIKVGANCTIQVDGTLDVVQGSYTLPIATASALGGIKVGSRLTIDAVSGVLDADVQTFAQVQSDWNATTGLGEILNKPYIAPISNTTPTSGDILKWNGTEWAPGTDLQGSGGGGGGTTSDPIGTIVMWSGADNAIPTGYQLCNGGASATTELQAIRANVPDLRDKFVIGAGSTYAVDATGGSADAVVIDHYHEGASHNHGLSQSVNISASGTTDSSDVPHTHSINGTVGIGSGLEQGNDWTGDHQPRTSGAATGTGHTHPFSFSTTANLTGSTGFDGTGNTTSVGVSGTGLNIPPYYSLCYIIKNAATTSGGSSGIALTDLSVTSNAVGTAALSYDNSTGVFSYTPPDLSGYALVSTSLNSLSDVDTTGAVNGKILKYDGTSWVIGNDNDSGTVGSSSFSGLSDTPVQLGSAGQYLKMNASGTSLEWTNVGGGSGGGAGVVLGFDSVNSTGPLTFTEETWTDTGLEITYTPQSSDTKIILRSYLNLRGRSDGTGSTPTGQENFTSPGTHNWTCPADVTSVCAVCIGGGGSGWGNTSSSITPGGGGGLGWKNDITVVPGQTYTVQVGAAGGDSYFINDTTVKGGGGGGSPVNYGAAGTFVGDGGGNGANGSGVWAGGGAGGYSGDGGKGGFSTTTASSAGAGGGGGGGGGGSFPAAGGGGVGILGEGANGAGGNEAQNLGGQGGSGGATGGSGSSARGGDGGAYGGGGGVGDQNNYGGVGAQGAVRLIWGTGRAYPNTLTTDQNAGAGVATASRGNANIRMLEGSTVVGEQQYLNWGVGTDDVTEKEWQFTQYTEYDNTDTNQKVFKVQLYEETGELILNNSNGQSYFTLMEVDNNPSGGGGGGGTTTLINNNADNRIITGSATTDTLEAESNATYDGLKLNINSTDGSGQSITASGIIKAGTHLEATGRVSVNEDIISNGFKFTQSSEELVVGDPTGTNVTIVGGNVQPTGSILDKDSQNGLAGQILSSTGTQLDWIDPPTSGTTLTADEETIQIVNNVISRKGSFHLEQYGYSATHPINADVTGWLVIVTGGGGGAGTAHGGPSSGAGTGGGGGGGTAMFFYDKAQMGTGTMSFTIGNAGVQGSGADSAGGAGGYSYFYVGTNGTGPTLTAHGGAGSGSQNGGSGTGGAGANGTWPPSGGAVSRGHDGMDGIGYGGIGQGGEAGISLPGPGTAGANWGRGAKGAGSIDGNWNASGQVGLSGMVVIYEF